jgi:hypothetical protein
MITFHGPENLAYDEYRFINNCREWVEGLYKKTRPKNGWKIYAVLDFAEWAEW